ncbi:MAG: hypothetical protein AB7D37_13935 [Desulfovibrio sp.]
MDMMLSLVSVEGCNAGGSGFVTGVNRFKNNHLFLQINPAALATTKQLDNIIISPVLSLVSPCGVFFKENQNDRKFPRITPRRAVTFGRPLPNPGERWHKTPSFPPGDAPRRQGVFP